MTVESVNDQVAALRRELKLTWDAHEREHVQHELSHAREHDFSQKAIDTAALMAKENKADANEWRATMNDREAKFATKEDVKNIGEKIQRLTDSQGGFSTTSDLRSLGEKIDKLEDTEIRRAETERLRLITEAEDKRQSERRTTRSQWTIGIVVGLLASFGAVLVNLVIRLLTTT